jgi:alpha-galactosidase
MVTIRTRRSFLTAAGLSAGALSLGNQALAQTPPMGWMSWNLFGRNISDRLIREIADAMATNGMKAAGYRYVCIDDHWHGGRDRHKRLYPHPEKFPQGIKPLADYVHSKGLLLGIYSDAGNMTCGKEPGSFGYEEIDAQTFASWKVDYVKYDYCYAPEDQETAIARYSAMGRALSKTGRPMVYSICEWGPRQPWLWAARAGGHLWRTTWDVRDVWEAGRYEAAITGILEIVDRQAGLEQYAGPGHWNDPDMLVVGLYGKGGATTRKGVASCNDTEYRSQMTLWCLLAAPLLATCDVRSMNDVTREILTNREAIAINQDPLGKQASRVARDGQIDFWLKPLSGGRHALGVLNRGTETKSVTVNWNDLRLKPKQSVHDVWLKKDLDVRAGSLTLDVPSHATALLRLAGT